MKQLTGWEACSIFLCFMGNGLRLGRLAALALCLTVSASAVYPPAGVDTFDSMGMFRVSSQAFGLPETEVVMTGSGQFKRGTPFDPGDGLTEILTEIENLVLSGSTAVGTVLVKALPPSAGKIKRMERGFDFPADAFFRVRFEVQISTPSGTVRLFSDPSQPILLRTTIEKIPFGGEYKTEDTFTGVNLLNEAGQAVGIAGFASFFVSEQPTFSVAPGGPSNLGAADLFGRPTTPKIRAAALGLVSGDNLDALSYGFDFMYSSLTDLRLSVDPNSQGRLGSHVRREATKSPKEAHGDEFRVIPFPHSGGGSNLQVFDENGDTELPFPLLISDDVDGLTDQPPEFVDGDGDGIPEKPVYFSLSAGSPSLATLGVRPADILVTSNGARPTVFIPHTDLALTSNDDVDAICLSASNKNILYSLAPNSPSLAEQSAADTFLAAPPPVSALRRWYSSGNLGLEASDNLNAMKCLSGEIDEFVLSELSFILISGQSTEQIKLACRSGATFATKYGGHTGRGSARGVVYLFSSLYCTGNSRSGPISARLRGPGEFPNMPSGGQIFDNDDDGLLNVEPWRKGQATMTANLLLHIDIGTTMGLHHPSPITLRGTVTRKPPKPGEFLIPGGSTTPLNEKDPVRVDQTGPTPLFLEGGVATGFSITQVRYVPDARPKPQFTANGFRDAAAGGVQPSPGALASLYGTFDTTAEPASAIPLPRVLGDAVQVKFVVPSGSVAALKDRKEQAATVELPAPLTYVSATQINLQVPWEVDPNTGTVMAIVSVNGVDSDPVELQIAPTSPGIFAFDPGGRGRAVVFNVDGSLAHPEGSIPGFANRPAVIGQPATILATGLGRTSPRGITGPNSYDVNGNFVRRDAVETPRVLIGGREAVVGFAGLSPEFVGVFQINVTVPQGVTPGNQVPVVIETGGRSSPEGLTMSVAATGGL